MSTTLKRIGLFLVTNLLVILVVSAVGMIFKIDFTQGGYLGLLILCLLFGMTGAFISLWMSRWIAKKVYKIQLIDPLRASGRELQIYNTIKQMADYMRMPMPEVGIYNRPEVNAFATGASQNSSLIAFSAGLVNKLNDDELASVAGHEMSHIQNGDMVTMTLLTGIANTFVMFFARVLAIAISVAMRDNDRRGGGLGYMGYWLLVILLENVLMLLAYIPICYFSRWREYRADSGAARLTSPHAMINALLRIESAYQQTPEKDSYAMAKISNHRKASLYSTHPSIEDRVKRLQQMAI